MPWQSAQTSPQTIEPGKCRPRRFWVARQTATLAAGLGVGALLLVASPAQAGSYQITASRDSYLKQSSSNDNFQIDSELLVKTISGDTLRAVYYFDLSSIPSGETVTHANLRLYVTQSADSAVRVHRITDSWTESGVTWNNTAADFDATQDATFTPSSTEVFLTIGITALVQGWRSGTANHGVMLISAGIDQRSKFTSREWSTSSQRPRLDVTTVLTANISTSKISQVLQDPANGTTNPKLIPGAAVRYTITAINTGAGAASNVLVTDPVPANLTYAAGSLTLAAASLTDASDADAGAYNSGTRTITVNIGTLAASGGSATITLNATID